MNIFLEYLKKPVVRRLAVFIMLGLIAYLLRSFMTMFLLTFILIYLVNSAQNFVYKCLHRIMPVNRSVVVAAIYVLSVGLLVLFGFIYIPTLVEQTSNIVNRLSTFITGTVGSLKSDSNKWIADAATYVSTKVDIGKYVESGGTKLIGLLGDIGSVGFDIVMALLLSLFFMLQKKTMKNFLARFRTSKLYWMYGDVRYIVKKFANSFGKVIQTQLLISFINTVLSIISLSFMGFQNVIGLGAMIFMLGLIPIAGVFISLIPLSIIAYISGGFIKVFYVLILIVVLHALESYVLNPKLMSQTARMPVFITFVVLLISERFLGIWGLIVGLPIAMFLMDLLDIVPDNQPDDDETADMPKPLKTESQEPK